MLRGLSSSAVFLLALLFFFLPWMSDYLLRRGDTHVRPGTDIMGITKVDDVPSEVANDDYGIGDALGSEAALLYVAALLVIVGGSVFFLPERRGSYIRAGIAGVGLLCLLAYVFLTLSSAASELGVGVGELGEAGLGIGWQDRTLAVASGPGRRHRPAVHPDAVRQ